jgi:PKD repeat protein
MAIDGVMIYHPPVAMFDYLLDPATLTVAFTDQSLYADDMTFDLGDGTMLTAVPPTHTYSAITSYVVEQVVSNDFGTDSYAVEINNLNVVDLEEDGIVVYPNPASDRIILKLSSVSDYNSWSISSIQGAEMATGLITKDSETIDLNGLSKGVYLLELTGSKLKSIRIVLQ